MRYKENDIIRICEDVYQIIEIQNIKNIPGFDSDFFYYLKSLTTDTRILLESKSVDHGDTRIIKKKNTREQKLNNILK